jgi:hypothetical protein
VNNRSVKLTQGDLMLCQKCDSIRFPPPLTNSGPALSDKNDANVTAKVNVTAKPKKIVCTATNHATASGNNPV